MIRKRKGRIRMATQLQSTPTLFGQDAKDVLKEVLRKPTKEQKEKLRDQYQKMFEGVKTKGF